MLLEGELFSQPPEQHHETTAQEDMTKCKDNSPQSHAGSRFHLVVGEQLATLDV